MNKIVSFLLIVTVFYANGQKDKYTFANLIGAWKFDSVEYGNEFDVRIYNRTNIRKYGVVHNFYSNGNFEITNNRPFSKGRKIIRCGTPPHNGQKVQNIFGTYIFDKKSQKLNFKKNKNNDSEIWELVWINEIHSG